MTVASALALAWSGCAADVGDLEGEPFADSISGLSADDCFPRGNRFNCRPDSNDRGLPRVYNPYTHGIDWPLSSSTPLWDGEGHVRGNVTSSSVKINHGQRKRLHGQTVVYVWAARLDTGIAASGWVLESALRHRRTLQRRMRTVALPNPGRGHYQTRWIITGGDNARYDGLTVTRGHSGGGRRATDYLMRPGRVVNITYNVPGFELGGYNVDTFQPGAIFRRARGVNQIVIPLYRLGGTTAVGSMHFVYGYVHDGQQRRYGWMPKEALRNGGTPAPSEGSCAARCCDGHLATGLSSDDERMCVRASSEACSGHGYVQRTRLGGELVYRRRSFCWARCNGGGSYTRLDDVTRDCTARAVAHCGGAGLEDAMWDACQPI